jgi:type III restriction enzyme
MSKLQIRFDSDQEHQIRGVEAACELFVGQQLGRSEFTITLPGDANQQRIDESFNDLGIGNNLTLLDDEILANLQRVQIGNALPADDELKSGEFTIEMETGTGKTYVYLRTIMELHKQYGFTKFIIVVPSVAIKEGTLKSLQMTEDHLKSLYGGVPYEYFVYDSANMEQVLSFARSSDLQIMVMTVGAINKMEKNKVYQVNEKTDGRAPIELLRATQPILIVDEPQSVEGGLKGKGKEALKELNPLCTFRYSATPKNTDHLIYELNAVEAYQQGLVKQIEVASITVTDSDNEAYVRCVDIKSTTTTLSARLELSVEARNGGVKNKTVTVHSGDDLEQETKRSVYENYRIGGITGGEGGYVELETPGATHQLKKGDVIGAGNLQGLHQEMIRETIEAHFRKELDLRNRGIKVLSLFFIDQVANYRVHNDDGEQEPGPYAKMFEEQFVKVAGLDEFKELFEGVDPRELASTVHDGYFSKDKKGRDVVEMTEGKAGNADAERGYKLIMKEKEKLLSLDEPLKFIFSHSALREGWDNPNVFQICTLREIKSEMQRRQTIGRGLRICVNQDGDRDWDRNVNVLTVVANESYQEFAEGLQTEIEKDTGIRFGIVAAEKLAAIPTVDAHGQTVPLGIQRAGVLLDFLQGEDLVSANGKVEDELRSALKSGNLELPEEFEPDRVEIEALLKKLAGKLEIRDGKDKRRVHVRKEILESEEFKALWERVNQKTTYRVAFGEDKLIQTCARALEEGPKVARPRAEKRVAGLGIGVGGVEAEEKQGLGTSRAIEPGDINWPDLLGVLQESTQLTRRSLYRIIVDSGRLEDFRINPQSFVEIATGVINRQKELALVDGIKYQRLGDEEIYAQEMFTDEELTAYVSGAQMNDPDSNIVSGSRKSVLEPVVGDANTERDFAKELEASSGVKVYAKLPGWFKVTTPLGNYNPDWAVLFDDGESERLYFVVETKSSQYKEDVRNTEAAKIRCGRAHFAAIAVDPDPAEYIEGATEFKDVLNSSKRVKGN